MDLTTNNVEPLKYNPFHDKYLESYFKSPTLQTHLRSIGLMSKDGREVTEEEFKRAAIRRQQRWAARQLMAQRSVLQNRDFQMGRQLELRRQLDAVQKVEIYRKVKGNAGHELVHIEPLDLEKSLNRSHSAPGLRMFRRGSLPTSTTSPEQLMQSSGYQTDDDRPKSLPHTQDSGRSSREKNLRKRYLSDQYRFQYLHKLDNSSLEDYESHLRRQLDQIEKFRRRVQNYYSFDERLGLLPSSNSPLDIPSSFRQRSSSNGNSARWNHLRFNKRARSISPPQNKKIGKQRQIYVTSAAVRKRRQLQPSCECFLQYLGPSYANEENFRESNISITQQHSGGNSIVVFKEDLAPKAKFQFVSYRQKGFPFSLTISDNNQVVHKLSTCCESRYAVASKLGGKQGIFKWLGVKNAVPCYKCQMHRGLEAPYTNFGQKKKKLKLVKKKSSEDEGLEKDNEATHGDVTTDDDKEQPKPTSAKPPRPQSASSKSKRGSITGSTTGIIAAGTAAAGVAAVGGTLAVIDDLDEGLHSKVPSEHGSSLKASSDEEGESDKQDNHATAEENSQEESKGDQSAHDKDDFFDKDDDHEKQSEKDEGDSNSAASSSESSDGSESESEEEHKKDPQTGKWSLEKENSLENKEISSSNQDSTSKSDDEEDSSKIAENSMNEDEMTKNPVTGDISLIDYETGTKVVEDSNETSSKSEENDTKLEENDTKLEENDTKLEESEANEEENDAKMEGIDQEMNLKNEEENVSESETESKSDNLSKSRKSSLASSRKSRINSTDSEQRRRKESIASGWGSTASESETEREHEPTIKEENETENNETNGKNESETVEPGPVEEHKEIGTDPEVEHKETTERTVSESESESGSSFSDSESEETESVSKAIDGNKEPTFAEKLKEAGSAFIADGNNLETVGETVVLVDVHKNGNNIDQKSMMPWICSECNFDNDGDENSCRICGANRDNEPVEEPKSDDQNGDKTDANEAEPEVGNLQGEEDLEKNDNDNDLNDANNKNDQLENEHWSCKFCGTNNESTSNNCQTCLLPKSYTKPNDDSLGTGSGFSSETNKTDEKTEAADEINDEHEKVSEENHNQNDFDEEEKHAADGGIPNQADKPSSRNSSAKSHRSQNDDDDRDTDTLADARSIQNVDDEHHLMAPSIEVQPPSPSVVSSLHGSKISETPRSQKIVAEIKKIDINQANNYLKEFLAEDLNNHQPETSSAEHEMAAVVEESGPISDETVHENSSIPHVDGLPDELVENISKPEAVLNNVDLSLEEVEKVALVLSKNENLNSLTIKSAKFTDEHLQIISNVLSESKAQLRVINLNVNMLTSSSVPSILNLMKNKPVDILSIHDNHLGDDGVAQLVNGLIDLQNDQNSKLRRLDVGENDLGHQAASMLGQYIAQNDQLQCLTISGSSKIGDPINGWISLAEGLAANNSIQSLLLDYCQMGDANMEIICHSLKNKENLKTLDIEGNNLNPIGAENPKGSSAVVELVRSCPNIKNVMWMAGNIITSDHLNLVEQIINARQYVGEKDHLSLSAAHFMK